VLGRPPFAAVGLDTPETVADTPKRSTTIGNRNVPRPAPMRLTAAANPVPIPRTSVGNTSPG